jgi:predicted CXXCH cytochrome family protein
MCSWTGMPRLSTWLPRGAFGCRVALWAALAMAGMGVQAQVAGAPKRPPGQPAPGAAQASGVPGAGQFQNPAASCTTTECHQPILNHSVRHNPAAADCSACHVAVGEASAHKFALPVSREDLCIRCHQLPAEAHGHAPVKDGKCMECHDPHGSEHRAQLVGDPNRDLCVRCHNASFMQKKFVHGPVAVGACATCHKPHSSDIPKLLSADANTLCKTCHADTGKAEPGVHLHKALDQGCVSCHDAHAADHKFQLRETAPNLCLSCHKGQIDKMTAGAGSVHSAITDEGGCTSCHEPHASKLAGLQRATQPETCLKCHDKPVKATDGVMLTNMSKLLANNSQKHGPIRDGHCTVCHDPHASKNFRLLPAEYPEKFYAPFSLDLYKLCFQCHSPDMVLKQNAQGVTQFRDGSKNLHMLHVNQEKGRTCRACHEVHASSRGSHMRDAVPFGTSNWMLEINYKPSEEGGSCAPGCHAPKTYARPQAAKLIPKNWPDQPKTDQPKTDQPKTDQANPDPSKSEGSRPEGSKPGAGTPESPAPAGSGAPSTVPGAAPAEKPGASR